MPIRPPISVDRPRELYCLDGRKTGFVQRLSLFKAMSLKQTTASPPIDQSTSRTSLSFPSLKSMLLYMHNHVFLTLDFCDEAESSNESF